ncbi:MAG TPA: PilC/PilY family type IV pilus protein, partial [Usitatibacter sp.]|nr:PilC/PilY family type IV pilus protein [Usitatibacter sp.]
MSLLRKSSFLSALLSFGLALMPLRAPADDIDLFIGASGGAVSGPHVIILYDNMGNWVSDQPNGKSRLLAVAAVLNSITQPMYIGLATFSYNSPAGAYIRFAPRDMSNTTNRTALQNLLNVISQDANVNLETGNNKDEAAALYEMYKFFSGLKPLSGSLAQNAYADAVGNVIAGYPGSTGASQGMTTDFAFKADGTYNSSNLVGCGKNYIIYITANNQTPGGLGQQIYEGLDSGPAILPAPGAPETWADEWARYLYSRTKPQIVTYVLDGYFPDDNQDAGYSTSLQAMAKQGGGSYKHVRNQTEIQNELLRIFAEIKAVNSTFASASLPVNATNRSQNQNQVFIGMFRPDPVAKPLWFGNMKRYQLILNAGSIELGDAVGLPAVNTQTGFLTDCAASFWTTDSKANVAAPAPGYWANVPTNPSAAGTCPTTGFDKFSDSPDGSFVEKGATAEVIRKGNNPPGTNGAPTFAVSRNVWTLSGAGLATFNTGSSGLSASVVNFISGQDVNDENANGNITEARPSLHGDVIHSRPLPVNYTTGPVTTFYGANDGTLRAVDAATGKELWSFIAPEFFPRLQRLMDNSPIIKFPNQTGLVIVPTPTPKDYFFDGSVGLFHDANSSRVWMYPSMRRGGRMIYGFDVTTPSATAPVFKWARGCPHLTDDVGCSAGFTGIGQTWSQPNVAFIKGYKGGVAGTAPTSPVVIFGGGSDACEDADTATPTCAGEKGTGVYIVDADTGALLQFLATDRAVVADVVLVDIDFDGNVDYGYAVDTGGNIYRISFYNDPSTKGPLSAGSWAIRKIAATSGAGRKFQFAPALFLNGKTVYVAVGSGDREHPLGPPKQQYPYGSVVNRFYVYLDTLTAITDVTGPSNLDDLSTMSDFTATPDCNGSKVLPTSPQKGWFRTLNAYGQGEQTVTSAAIAGGLVTFSTNRPIPPPSGGCPTVLGEARGYFLNLLTGSGAIGIAGACGG